MMENWRDFENYVALLYSSLGFSVKHDVEIKGKQVDIFVERSFSGIGHMKVAIECKFRRDQSSVSNNEVNGFLAFAESARVQGAITQGVMITNSNYTRYAKQAAECSTALNLLTIRELENQLFELQDAYLDFVRDYEKRGIFVSYVPLSGAVSAALHTLESRQIDNVQESIISWFKESNVGFVSVLAGFGGGKTTLLERLKYEYAKMYLKGLTTRKPVLFYLKEYHKHPDLESFISHTVAMEFKREVPLSLFWRTAQEGQFVLLLDGFDEMVPQSDRQKRAEQFSVLGRLFATQSPAILTCRPAYFITAEEYDAAIEAISLAKRPVGPVKELTASQTYRSSAKALDILRGYLRSVFLPQEETPKAVFSESLTVELDTFNQERIDQFLRNQDERFREASEGQYSWQEIRDFLYRVYDISDLMKRPILLDMITETVISGAIEIDRTDMTVGPTSLYELYTDMQFDRDWQKGVTRQQLLSREQRRTFAQAIALTMFKKGTLEVDYQEILTLIKSHMGEMGPLDQVLEKATLEEIATDIQICTFLSANKEGTFRFAHKSFMEYFIARHIRKRFTRDHKEPLLLSLLPKEILYFLGGYGFVDARFRDLLKDAILGKFNWPSGADAYFRRNMIAAMLYSSAQQKNLKLSHAGVDLIDVGSQELVRCQFEDFVFDKVTFDVVSFRECKLRDVRLENCEGRSFKFEQTQAMFNARNSICKAVEMLGGEMSFACRDCEFGRFSVKYGTASISGAWNADELRSANARMTLSLTDCRVKSIKLEDSYLVIEGSGSISSLRSVNSTVFLQASGAFTGLRFEESSLVIQPSAGASAELSDVEIEGGSITFKRDPSRGSICQIWQAKATNSLVLGVPIPYQEFKSNVKSDKKVTFDNCKGFILVTSGGLKKHTGVVSGVSKPEKGFYAGLYVVREDAFWGDLRLQEELISRIETGMGHQVADEIRNLVGK